ncbi:hypothetical protein [Kordiimonas lacus]|uniref:Uncharacterized protein n=1 Tax=Kordiimonas lacus TaxID=637679 RepID=A0A1G6TGJ9_9PROT|nr:hypothetical protein [Kordiimonas lacus]SDD27984.1 hypothetical protein SAMN04488071_0224 [Kordiimonas lacus]
MPRKVEYGLGAVLMLVLLGVAILGPKGFFPDAYGARGCLLGVFLMMRWRRSHFGVLLTKQVLLSGLAGAFIGSVVGRFLMPTPPGWSFETAMVMPSALFHAALMVASFHYLTLGRGRMP